MGYRVGWRDRVAYRLASWCLGLGSREYRAFVKLSSEIGVAEICRRAETGELFDG